MIDLKQVEDVVRQEVTKRVLDELSTTNISASVERTLLAIAQDKVDVLITSMLNRMITDHSLQTIVNTKLVAGLQDKLEAAITNRVVGTVSRVDIGQTVTDKIIEYVDSKMKTGNLPDKFIPQKAVDLSNLTIRPSQVTNGKFVNFRSTGVIDGATDTVLTVTDGLVVVAGQVNSTRVVAGSASIGELEVNKLTVAGELIIQSPTFASDLGAIILVKLEEERSNWKLDVGTGALYANDKLLLSVDTLAPTVATSNLRKVGNLIELNVMGPASIANTLNVQGNKVGINTEEPSGALHVWDQETEFAIRRHQSRTTYIGTMRDNDLLIGVNGEVVLSLRKDGTTETKKISVDGLKISVADAAPSTMGTPGEIVIMRRAVSGQPWAYQCTEGQTWVALQR